MDTLDIKGKFSSLELYQSFLGKLNKWYRSGENIDNPVLDLRDVKWIEALAIPNILVIGNIMRAFHKKPIKLLLPTDLEVINFLNKIDFFSASNLGNIKLFNYDEDMINKAGFFVNSDIRKEHKIYCYKPELMYYKLNNETEQLKYRAAMYENIRYIVVPHQYKKVLMDKDILSENEMEILLDIISEIICNCILYSKSISYSFIQTNRFKSSFSISDAGIGFKKSLLSKRNMNLYFSNKYAVESEYDKYSDFITIMDVLYYSMKQKRRNLWSLKELIVNRGGTLRIHNNSTQIVFTANKCAGCIKRADECFRCLMDSYKKGYSNLRIFDGNLIGVHIEVELTNNDRREEV